MNSELRQESPQYFLSETSYRLLSGGMAGIISRSFLAPIERIIILRQTNDPIYFKKGMKKKFQKNILLEGLIETLVQIYRNEGAKNLFKGNLANCFRIGPYQAIEFSVYDLLRKYYVPHVANYIGYHKSMFIAGGLSGALAVLFVYPFDLVKTILAMQHDKQTNYSGILNTMKNVVINKGVLGLWRGVSATLIGMTPYASLKLNFFQLVSGYGNKWASKNQQRYLSIIIFFCCCYFNQDLCYGSIAGCMALTITYPTDVIRRRLQATILKDIKATYLGTIREIYTEQGIRVFYYGMMATYMKIIPSAGLAFYFNEKFKSFRGYI